MTRNFQNIFDVPTKKSREEVAHLGFAVRLMSNSSAHSRLPVVYIKDVLDQAFRHKQIRYFFNADGEPVGYVVWAKITIDVQKKILETGSWNLHKSEWNEGEILWVVDFLALYGNLNFILQSLRDDVFSNFSSVRYIRFKNNKAIFKEIARDNFCRFMRSSTMLL